MSDTLGDSPAGVAVEDQSPGAVLDGEQFLNMTTAATPAVGAKYGALVLVDGDDLTFRARFGFPEVMTPREGLLWDAAMDSDEPLVVLDLDSDPRFAPGPYSVGGVPVRFFASCAFHGEDGQRIGVFCIADPGLVEFGLPTQLALNAVVTFTDAELSAIYELNRAAVVQRALLPKTLPPLEGYEVAGVCVPAKAVGGDFFDWYAIDDGIAFTLADVMGKGVGAGIIAATVRATVRSAMDVPDVVVAIDRAAETLFEDLEEAGSFVTLFHARLRAADGSVSFVDAGHGLTVVVGADGNARRLSATNLPLGIGLGSIWHPKRILLEVGATLVSFSDGVLDLYDGSLESVNRVADIVRGASSAQEIIDEIERLARREAAPDDITAVVIRRTGA